LHGHNAGIRWILSVRNGEGFRTPASCAEGRSGTLRPAFESLPRRKPRSGKGAGAARSTYGDLRIANRRLRNFETKTDRACAEFGGRSTGLARAEGSVLSVFGAGVGDLLAFTSKARPR